jgi:homoserine kinase
MVERHPDNVTAALVGGFVGSYLRELSREAEEAASVPLAEVLPEYPPDASADWGKDPPSPPEGIGHFVRFGWAREIRAVAIIPQFELSTAKAREVLPLAYTRKDLVSKSFSYQVRINTLYLFVSTCFGDGHAFLGTVI